MIPFRLAVPVILLSSFAVGCGASQSVLFDGDQLSGQSIIDVMSYRFDAEETPTREFGDCTAFDRSDASTESLSRLLTMVVIRATGTDSVESAFEEMGDSGASTHFFIDQRGRVFQALDLVYAASPTDDSTMHMVAIHLVNPLPDLIGDTEMAAACERAAQAGLSWEPSDWHEHHCHGWVTSGLLPSDVLEINGQNRRSLAYTEAQHQALVALLRDLGEHFPGLTDQLPTTMDGNIVNRALVLSPTDGGAPFRGVVAEWHIDAESWSPGPGLDWTVIEAGLAEPAEE